MEKIIRDTLEYDLANEQLEGILDEIDKEIKPFFKTGSSEKGELIIRFLNNYKMIGNNIDNFGDKNLEDANYKIDLIEGYLSGKNKINYVKNNWFIDD
jgi:hypothetical protein